MKVATLNNFVKSFLSSNQESDGSNDLIQEAWMSAENQKKIKSLLNRNDNSPKKDPNSPKKAMSAYLFYCQDNRKNVRDSLVSQGLDAGTTDVTVKLGQMWNNIKNGSDASSKAYYKKYLDLASKDGERYRTEMASYTPSEEYASTRRGSKKDPSAPKRAKSAYLYFCEKMRNTVKDELGESAKATDVTKELGARWKDLKTRSESGDKSATKELKSFETKAESDSDRYKTEKTAYTSSNTTEQSSSRKPRKVAAPVTKTATKTRATTTKASPSKAASSSSDMPAPKKRSTSPKKQ